MLLEPGSAPAVYRCPACGEAVYQVLLPVGEHRRGRESLGARRSFVFWLERECRDVGTKREHLCVGGLTARAERAEGRG